MKGHIGYVGQGQFRTKRAISGHNGAFKVVTARDIRKPINHGGISGF